MNKQDTESCHARWARLRFTVIGTLLSSPPPKGQLYEALLELTKKPWRHPTTSLPIHFGLSTIERWYYRAKKEADPVNALRHKPRSDAGQQRVFGLPLKQALKEQYQAHKSWSYQLHVDNLKALTQQQPALGLTPSYSTVRRYMKAQGMFKQRRILKRSTAGTLAAEQRLESWEVRSYEADHVHGLWHLDFHHGSRQILLPDGRWVKPMLLAIMDDHSRIICHAQWYLDETTESLVHGFCQAIQKRAIPRAVMTDNGSAMRSDEFTQGLERLGILHQTTLPYSPYQNGKQEFFWTNIEGRLMPMLEGEEEMTLALLNKATQAWLELEYHHKKHSELGCSPTNRYINAPFVGRVSLRTLQLHQAFRHQVKRKQRRSDGTITIESQRFEVPSQYRHVETVFVQYARWDMTQVHLIDIDNNTLLCRIYPLDKSANATGKRRVLAQNNQGSDAVTTPAGIAPLLKQLMADYAATGLPPAYSPKDNPKPDHQEEKQ